MNKSLAIKLAMAAFFGALGLIASVSTAQTSDPSVKDSPSVKENRQQVTDSGQKKENWIQLFNGKDLSGWTPKIRGHKLGDNYADTFRVVDGLLTVSYDKYKPEDSLSMDDGKTPDFNKFGHLFYKDSFSHYLLRVEYRFVGNQIANGPGWAYRNNGLMLHGQDPAKMAVMQKFPISIEVQLLGGEHNRTTLNLCTPGTNVVKEGKLFQPHCTKSSSEMYPGDQWVTAEVEVRGSKVIRHKIAGKTVLEYTEPQYDARDAGAGNKKKKNTSFGGTPDLMKEMIKDGNLLIESGTISIQSESHPTQFRKIELLKLSPESDSN